MIDPNDPRNAPGYRVEIVTASSADALEVAVNAHLAMGWRVPLSFDLSRAPYVAVISFSRHDGDVGPLCPKCKAAAHPAP